MTFIEALEKAKSDGLWARPSRSCEIERGPIKYAGAIAWSDSRGWIFVPEASGGVSATIPRLSALKGEWEAVEPKVVLDGLVAQ